MWEGRGKYGVHTWKAKADIALWVQDQHGVQSKFQGRFQNYIAKPCLRNLKNKKNIEYRIENIYYKIWILNEGTSVILALQSLYFSSTSSHTFWKDVSRLYLPHSVVVKIKCANPKKKDLRNKNIQAVNWVIIIFINTVLSD